MPLPALRGEVIVVDEGPGYYAELTRLREENAQLKQHLQQSQAAYSALEHRTSQIILALRRQFRPMFETLAAVFSDIDRVSVPENPHTSEVWEAWKQRLGGLPAKAIDALLLHREMTRAQLRIAVGCATRSVTDIVYKLNQAGLINKNGSKISLKEL